MRSGKVINDKALELMKPLTAKKRREIYLKVAERISELINDPYADVYLCGKLADELHCGDFYSSGLPEFDLFEPTTKEKLIEGTGDYDLWWHDFPQRYAANVRIICMLLCAEMTKK